MIKYSLGFAFAAIVILRPEQHCSAQWLQRNNCSVATLPYGHCSANSQMLIFTGCNGQSSQVKGNQESLSLVNHSKSIEDAWRRLAKLDHKFDDGGFEMGRFIGFVEGRLGVRLPNGFVHKILENRRAKLLAINVAPLESFRTKQFDGEAKPPRFDGVGGANSGLKFDSRDNVWVVRSGDLMIPVRGLSVDGERFVTLDGDDFRIEYIALLPVEPNGVVVAFYHPANEKPFKLIVLENDGSERWSVQSQSYALPDGTSFIGPLSSYCAIVSSDESVFVFGQSLNRPFIEGFDLKSGERTLGFLAD